MPLAPRSRLGPYEITGPLGAGGMGEVYRARDLRLGRDVAIKILPAEAAGRSESRERFVREARLVSSLNHRNVCTLHDVGTEGDVDYLVMELLDGETLAARLARGPIPIDQAVRIGVEIASALAAAHRAGIIHRDLKPGNVMLARGGTKVLDFGIATTAAALRAPGDLLTAGPTMTTPLTGGSQLVGTLAYMAPEQLEGKAVDQRADIFAFGAVLHEMVTGRRAFEGASPASTIAAILEREPATPVSLVPSSPPALDRLIRDCLRKDPDERRQSAHDLASELSGILESGASARVDPAAAPRPSSKTAWAIAALATIVAVIAIAFTVGSSRAKPTATGALDFDIPAAALGEFSPPALSPDGRDVAYGPSAGPGGRPSLFVRRLDDPAPRAIPGTELAARCFWSPDGRELAFFNSTKLMAVTIDGGHARVICDASYGVGGTWGADGTIVFSTSFYEGLRRVDAAGGEARPITTLDASRGETGHVWPAFLPGGRRLLFVSHTTASASNRIEAVGIDGGQRTTILEADALVGYSAPWLLFVKGGAVYAQRFDPTSLALSGERREVVDDAFFDENIVSGWAHAVSGTLVWSPHLPRPVVAEWYDDRGRPAGTAFQEPDVEAAVVSPDGARVALQKFDPEKGGADIWIHDFARSLTSRLTAEPGNHETGPWTPDGRVILFSSDTHGPYVTYLAPADGSAEPRELIGEKGSDWWPSSVAPDGKTLFAASEGGGPEFGGLWSVPIGSPESRKPWSASTAHELYPMVSPDGRAIAWISTRSGPFQVYARPVGGGAVTQVSTDAVMRTPPRWTRDGRAIWYFGVDRKLHRVAVRVDGGRVDADPPDPSVTIDASDIVSFDTAPAGRLLVLRHLGGASRGLEVRVGWAEALR
jgi:Tol biopolymer transport system component